MVASAMLGDDLNKISEARIRNSYIKLDDEMRKKYSEESIKLVEAGFAYLVQDHPELI